MTTSEARKRACRNYYHRHKAVSKPIMLRLNKVRDADIIAKLDSVPSKVDYIRRVVRADLEQADGESD